MQKRKINTLVDARERCSAAVLSVPRLTAYISKYLHPHRKGGGVPRLPQSAVKNKMHALHIPQRVSTLCRGVGFLLIRSKSTHVRPPVSPSESYYGYCNTDLDVCLSCGAATILRARNRPVAAARRLEGT